MGWDAQVFLRAAGKHMTKIIELDDGASAEPGRCGSCHLYRDRQNRDGFGLCGLTLPPWLENYFARIDKVYEVDPKTVKCTATCSFYRPKTVDGQPVTFVQKRAWRAGEASR